MSAGIQEKERHIFPRWRSFEATCALGELTRPAIPLAPDTSELDISLAKGIASWEMNRSLWLGLDLLGTAAVAGKLDSFPALIAEVRANPLAPQFAKKVLEKATGKRQTMQLALPEHDNVAGQTARKEIKRRRANLTDSPRDPIDWVELARAYTVAGEDRKAERAIRAALQLAPNNRFVLRSAARFFIHIGEPEIARALLSNSESSRSDPWLMASEIAIADFLGAQSKLPKIARLALERGMPSSDATELASALGSLEAAHGSDRAARRLLRQAVKGANENSVAQIQWLNRAHLGEAVDVSSAKPPLLHEANAWASYHKGEFETALEESLRWLTDQPFSSAPAILSSFILEDLMWEFESAREIAEAGLKSNPNDPMLLNNLAVCLMELDRIGEAEHVLGHLRAEDRASNAENTFRATFGMLEFRKGNVDEGRRLYNQAIERAISSGDKADTVRALFHLAFEEIRYGTNGIQDTLNRLAMTEDRNEVVETPRHLKRMRELLENANRP